MARFRREAHLLAALNHPHIAAIYGLEELGPGARLAMELVGGEDLAHRLGAGAIPVSEALDIARQIAQGLEAAHEKGIVHRDLKPANIKIAGDGTVKILDFGLAQRWEDDAASSGTSQALNSPTMTRHVTEAGLILGTAAYMAPEQARGTAIDKRADIWAFGVVFYELLTGRTLFAGDDDFRCARRGPAPGRESRRVACRHSARGARPDCSVSRARPERAPAGHR